MSAPRKHPTRHILAAAPVASFTSDAEKVWTEHLILTQSVIWITAVMAVMLTGVLRRWGDATYLIFSLFVAAPSVVLPALSRTRPDRARPWYQCYWLKLNVWVAIVVCFGSYFGTHYFFDLMGMRYAFGARWTFDSDIVGHSGQKVPVFMYPLTHAYFMTYFTFLLATERALVGRFRIGLFGRTAMVLTLAYAVASAETFFMASSLLSDIFAYENRDRMLRVGSVGYASYFVVGLPMVRRLDSNGELWTLDRVVLEAFSTSMMILVLLEAWAKLVGRL